MPRCGYADRTTNAPPETGARRTKHAPAKTVSIAVLQERSGCIRMTIAGETSCARSALLPEPESETLEVAEMMHARLFFWVSKTALSWKSTTTAIFPKAMTLPSLQHVATWRLDVSATLICRQTEPFLMSMSRGPNQRAATLQAKCPRCDSLARSNIRTVAVSDGGFRRDQDTPQRSCCWAGALILEPCSGTDSRTARSRSMV